MKPLTHRPLKRGEFSIGDYIPAADQATDAGRSDFWRRQQERIKFAQADRDEAEVKVRTLRKATIK